MESLPEDVRAYKQTPEFDELTVPKGLLRSHSTKAGVWARIRVKSGDLRYRVLEPEPVEYVLSPGRDGIVAPEVPHEVEPLGPVRFFVEFLKAPGPGAMQIEVVPPDPGWPDAYREEARRLRRALGDTCVAVHHIGSTSIPGIHAKPILDLCLEVTDVEALDARTDAMAALGYEAHGEYGIARRRFFTRDEGGRRTHHVHAFRAQDPEVLRHLAFRDYMIAHPAAATAYSDLKRDLAARHADDRDAYMDGKDPFIREHEERALAWAGLD